jgi:hypothetical protein
MADAKTWDDWTHAAFNIAGALAFLCAGAWTVVTFGVLGQRQRAAAENEHLRVQNEKLRQEMVRQASVSFELEASQVADPIHHEYILEITTTVRNAGNTVTVIDINEQPIRVDRVQFGPHGKFDATEIMKADLYVSGQATLSPAGGLVIMPQQTMRCASAVRLDGPGLYLIILSIQRPLADHEVAYAAGVARGAHIRWSASKLVSVPPYQPAVSVNRLARP